jgi:tRNA-specific 2-thiouridylase
VGRGADRDKDQSYVVGMLGQRQLGRLLFPVGTRRKDEVRALAASLGLRTAAKPDSQDVCFITSTGGRRRFLADRLELHPAVVRNRDGADVGRVEAVELITLGQRSGLGLPGGERRPRYAVDVDVPRRVVTVGGAEALLSAGVRLEGFAWADRPTDGGVLAQCSAHGAPRPGVLDLGTATLTWDQPQRRVAPGQTVVFYDDDEVLGSALAC